MKLKLYIIDQIAGILAGVKINRMEDKAAKSALMQDYLALRKVLKSAQEDKGEIIRKLQEDWGEELAAVEKYRREKKPVVGHLDYLEAERDANKAIQDLFSREVDITITPVSFEAFEGVSDALTLEQAALLQEVGIILET
jgi:nucleoside-specific outer membrane channel protein Tsx